MATKAEELQNVINDIRKETQRQTDVVQSGVTAISRLVEEISSRIPDTSDDITQENLDALREFVGKIKENTDGLAAAIPAGTPKDPALFNPAAANAVKPPQTGAGEPNPSGQSTDPGASGNASDDPNAPQQGG